MDLDKMTREELLEIAKKFLCRLKEDIETPNGERYEKNKWYFLLVSEDRNKLEYFIYKDNAERGIVFSDEEADEYLDF